MERNRIQELEAEVAQLEAQLRHRARMLARKDRRIAELERQIQQLKHAAADSDRPRSLPLFIKPAVERGRGKKPGRGEGHAAALRSIPKIDRHQFADTPLARKLLRWCRDALLLKKRWDQLPEREYQSKASRLEDRLDVLMLAEQDENVTAERIAKRLRRHRTELTRFLWDQKLEGTNNPAERAIRPAVVMRKITGGNRSEAGAMAWAKLASLVRSADQQGLGVYEETKKLIRDCWAMGR